MKQDQFRAKTPLSSSHLTCATHAEKHFTSSQSLKCTTEYIPDTSPTNVKFVNDHLHRKDILKLIC